MAVTPAGDLSALARYVEGAEPWEVLTEADLRAGERLLTAVSGQRGIRC